MSNMAGSDPVVTTPKTTVTPSTPVDTSTTSQPALKKQKVIIAPSSGGTDVALYQTGASSQAKATAQQMAQFQDYLAHVETNYQQFRADLSSGTLSSQTVQTAFDQANSLQQTLIIPDFAIPKRPNVIDAQSDNVPNKGNYKEGLRDNPNQMDFSNSKYQVKLEDYQSPWLNFNPNKINLKDTSMNLAKLAAGNVIANTATAALAAEGGAAVYGAGLLAEGGVTALLNAGLASAGVAELAPIVTGLGIEAGLTTAGISAAAVGTAVGAAVLVAGMVLTAMAAYGIYKSLGGEYEFSFTDLFKSRDKSP